MKQQPTGTDHRQVHQLANIMSNEEQRNKNTSRTTGQKIIKIQNKDKADIFANTMKKQFRINPRDDVDSEK